MKLIRKARALLNKLLALAKNVRRAPRRAAEWAGRAFESMGRVRAGVQRFGRNRDAERARQYAARIQADLTRQGLATKYTIKRFKRPLTRYRQVEFVPPLVVTATGVMMKINTGRLPHGVQIADIANPKVVETLSHSVHQEVFVDAKNPRAGTLLTVAEVGAVDGIPRLVWSDEVTVQEDTPLSFVVGRGKNGNVIDDIEKMPHYLVAGATRQGKSVHMWHIITTIARRNDPADVRMALFDLKRGAMFHPLRALPHLMFPIIDDLDKTIPALDALIEEMDTRYLTIRQRGQATVSAYNRLPGVDKIPLVLVALDELAEITRSENREIKSDGTALLVKLLRQAAGAGIHFVVSTQHPNADVLKGEIRANIPEAIAFRTAKRTQSEIIIEQRGAEKIRVKGRGLFKCGADLVELQTPLVNEGSGAHGIYTLVSAIVTKWADTEQQQIELAENKEAAEAEKYAALKQELVNYSLQFLNGEFKIREVFDAFKGRVAKSKVVAIASELENEGVLSPGVGRAPRRVVAARVPFQAVAATVGDAGGLCPETVTVPGNGTRNLVLPGEDVATQDAEVYELEPYELETIEVMQ